MNDHFERFLAARLFLPVLFLALFGGAPKARAHDMWADGSEVPGWVRSSCCGQAEAHVLGRDQYWIDAKGFHVKGLVMVVPIDQVLPSQDGKVWAFYADIGENATIHCVFYSGSI